MGAKNRPKSASFGFGQTTDRSVQRGVGTGAGVGGLGTGAGFFLSSENPTSPGMYDPKAKTISELRYNKTFQSVFDSGTARFDHTVLSSEFEAERLKVRTPHSKSTH